MKLIGYVRVSSEGQLDGYGLDVQRKVIRTWAKANKHTIVRIEEDAGISGAKDADERPSLRAALDSIKSRDAEGLLVACLDRLARDLYVQESLLRIIWKAKGAVFSVSEGEITEDDPEDEPTRKSVRQIIGVFADLDRRMVVKRLRDGRRAKASNGGKAVGEYPFGQMGGGKGRARDAVPNPVEQETVARILELRKAGTPYRTIAQTLDMEGMKPRRAQAWSAMAVRAVCQRAGLAP